MSLLLLQGCVEPIVDNSVRDHPSTVDVQARRTNAVFIVQPVVDLETVFSTDDLHVEFRVHNKSSSVVKLQELSLLLKILI
jgi:hypothetical protein